MADIAARGLSNSGIALQNRLNVLEQSLRDLCEARVQSYLDVLQEARSDLTEDDVQFIMSQVLPMSEQLVQSTAHAFNQGIQQTSAPIPASWALQNIERTKISAVATIRRNLIIEKGLQNIRRTSGNQKMDARLAFVIMSFRPDLNDLYDLAISPALTTIGLKSFRVDREEFDGTINEAVLDRLRTCRIVIADLTDERPNCYFELGYAMALGKPCVVLARDDHDPRRPLRNPNDPKVHFDIDSHKISFWKNDELANLRSEIEKRIRSILEL